MVIIQYAKRGPVMKNLRHMFFILTTGILLSMSCFIYSVDVGAGPAAMPPMSAEEQALAQQLDSVFTELTKGMSEQEKDQFYAELNTAMEEEIDKMSKMSDTQLNEYIEKAEQELKSMGPWPEQPQLPEETPQGEPFKPVAPSEIKEELPKKIEKPVRDMGPILSDILAHLESFLTKVTKVQDMSRYMNSWGKKGLLRNWNNTITWPVFKEKIETLKKTLYAIKSVDPKTQKAKHLVDLAEQEKLCNDLTKFRTNLVKHEPSMRIPTPGKKLAKESKPPVQTVIGDCLEALQVFNLQTELDKIIAKYEPTAKKIKEAEEQAAKKAQEEYRKRPTQPRPAVIAAPGAPEVGYYQHGVTEQRPTPPAGFGAYQPPAREEDKQTRPSMGGISDKGPEKKPTTEEKKGPAAPAAQKEKPQETETTKKLANYSDTISGALGEIAEIMEEDFDQGQIRNLMNNPTDDFIKLINTLTTKIRSVTRSTLNQARHNISQLEGKQKSEWLDKYHKLWNDYKGEFEDFARLF